jgi:hypothetical protein
VVPARVTSGISLSCTSPPVASTYEVQSVDVALLPFSPQVQVVRASTSPLAGSSLNISLIADPYIPQIQNLDFTVVRVNEVQTIETGVNITVPWVARLAVTDTGLQQEVQELRTYAESTPEVQYVIVRAPHTSLAASYPGGVQAVQLINILGTPTGGYFRLGLAGIYSANILWNATASELQSSLSTVFSIGAVAITQLSTSSWSVTFIQKLGPIFNLDSQAFLTPVMSVQVSSTTTGTTLPITGTFGLTFGGVSTTLLSVSADAPTVQAALRLNPLLSSVIVGRRELLNNGFMISLEFPPALGNVPPITIVSALSGTVVNSDVVTQQDGSLISGTFTVYKYGDNGALIESIALPFNASETALASAIESLDLTFGPVSVYKAPGTVDNTFIWEITFPSTAGSVNLLNANTADLRGTSAGAFFTRLQPGKLPNVVRVSTQGSSTLSGWFSLSVNGYSSEFIPVDASAGVLTQALEALPSVGMVIVSRVSTGAKDFSAWDAASSVRLTAELPLFEFDFNTFDWLVTFTSLSGPTPEISSCCDELTTLNSSLVTLTSEWTRDSAITITPIAVGSTETVHGSVSLSIGGYSTPMFSLDTTAADLLYILQEAGIMQVNVSRTSVDYNGHYSWDIAFLNQSLPYIDAWLAPQLAVATNLVYPLDGRDRVTFGWARVHAAPVHAVQRLTVTAGPVSCSITDYLGQTSSIIFAGAAPLPTVQSVFSAIALPYGGISVIQDSLAGTLLVVFDSYAHALSPMICTGATAVVLQDSLLIPLGGSFSISTASVNGNTSVISLPYNIDASSFESELNSLLGTGAVSVSSTIAAYNRYVWSITFIGGSQLGGNIDNLIVVNSNLTGSSAYVTVNETIQGSQPGGYLTLFTADNDSLLVAVNTSSFDLEFLLTSWLKVVSLSVNVAGPLGTSSGSISWTISYHKSRASGYIAFINTTTLTGTGVISLLSTQQIGTLNLGGTVDVYFNGSIVQTAIPVNSSLTELYTTVGSALATYGKYGISISNINNGVLWAFTFDYGISPPICTVNGSQLLGVNSLATVSTTPSSSQALGGSFRLIISNISTSALNVSATSQDVLNAISAIGIVDGVNVTSSGLSYSQAEWAISFNSLRFAGVIVNVTAVSDWNFPITGDDAEIKSSSSAGASSSLYLVDVVHAIGNETMTLYWDGLFVANISVNTTADASIITSSSNSIDYCFFERRVQGTNIAFYILVAPNSFSQINESTRLNATLSSNAITIVSLSAAANLDIAGSGQVAYSLGNKGCTAFLSGIYCSYSLPLESSPPIGVKASDEDMIASLGSLRNIIQVAVSSSALHGQVLGLGYVITGTRYLVTFVKAIDNDTSSEVYDNNELTWLPAYREVVFNSRRLLADTPFTKQSIPPTKVSQVFSVPDLVPNSSKLSSGWKVAVAEQVQGSDFRSGGDVNVTVSMNGQDYSSPPTVFHYINVAEISKLIPSHGPLNGNTEVLIWGNNFVNTPTLSCRFGTAGGGIVNAAYFFNSSALICISPPQIFAGLVAVTISNNGVFKKGEMSVSNVNYTYDSRVSINSIFPALGAVSGNFSVMVRGGPFTTTNELRCKFGNVVVRGYFMDTGEIQCFAPAYYPGVYPVEISINDQDYTSQRFPFFFYSVMTISTIFPPSGPALSAGTDVLVNGQGFVNTSSLSCKFGNGTTAARFVSSTLIVCTSPPLDGVMHDGMQVVGGGLIWTEEIYPVFYFYPRNLVRLVSLEVTNNAQEFTNSGIMFLYQGDSAVTDVRPKFGFIEENNPIVILGINFVNSTFLRCRIGAHVVNATFISKEAVLCFTPKYPLLKSWHAFESKIVSGSMQFGPTEVFVEIANNGQDFTNNRHTYIYETKCASGYYCPQFNRIPCPAGTFCPGESNYNYTLCPKGTYNPTTAMSECRRCPIGFMCPEAGMQVPRICASGFVCEFTGTTLSDNPCPAGHFCLEGKIYVCIDVLYDVSLSTNVGTATSATSCGHPNPSSSLFPILSHAERQSTLRAKRIADGLQLYLGSRRSGCWINETNDFGLQSSIYPSDFWSEKHMLPLASDSPFTPIRGRFCLDDSCLRLADDTDFKAMDYVFDYSASSYTLRRPIPCPPGVYCHPGTGEASVQVHNFSTAQACSESMYCPEGSATPIGMGECPAGYYCPFGVRIACPVGTYCPREGHWDPSPCVPGTFNGQLGSLKCSNCDRGYICPGFGRVSPAVCPAGYVCSKQALAIPNNLCIAGFYCPNGTATGDPLRNDTTRRPYPCSPGTYCLSGVGENIVKKGDFFYAQPCQSGFYCESASATARGSGLCPAGFICPEGTGTPRPAPKGSYSGFTGLSVASSCPPGFYAPTIESQSCYPCPPGSNCERGGAIIADLCPPGTYKGNFVLDGISCIACPQGTWSKQYGLREAGECIKCSPGTVCPVEGMTTPCAVADLPTLYEPIINYLGSPYTTYSYETTDLTVFYNAIDCLALNPGYTEGTMDVVDQQFFFGELIPPYIDILGRGSHFRSSDISSVKFASTARCYRNLNRFGSPVYQRFTEYYGPMYEIQTGVDYQGYGKFFPNGSYFYDGFFGSGSMSIDLPHARRFESAYNCTNGFVLMNQSLVLIDTSGLTVEVWTSPDNYGGLNSKILKGVDVFYPGTCEADRICYEAAATSLTSESDSCTAGFVCDEGTEASKVADYPCRAGFVCHVGSTPDPNIESNMGQFKRLCPRGYYCHDGTGVSEQFSLLCPANYFCTTGTGDPFIGTVANDALCRQLTAVEANPFIDLRHVRYFEDNDVRIVSSHDALCFEGVDSEYLEQYLVNWYSEGSNLSNPYIDFLREARPGENPYQNTAILTGHNDSKYYRPSVINSALNSDLRCARDHKWRLIQDVISRQECDCLEFLYVTIAVYRLWKCTSDGTLLGLGEASVDPFLLNGGRDFWFSREYLSSYQCIFPDSPNVTLTTGRVLENVNTLYPSIGPSSSGLLDLTSGLEIQFTWTTLKSFPTYLSLRSQVYSEWAAEMLDLRAGSRANIDHYIFNIFNAVGLIEEHGEHLEELVWVIDALDQYGLPTKAPGRLDVCACQNIYKCPNGTVSSTGSRQITDCKIPGIIKEVLRRIDAIPSWLDNNSPSVAGKLANVSDFFELTGYSH